MSGGERVIVSNEERVRLWPRVPDRSCSWCDARGECTWTLTGDLLCHWCLDIYGERAA
jgi:hypothetical protein